MPNKFKRGFTLMELIVVMSVLATLTVLGAVLFNKGLKTNRINDVNAEMQLFNADIQLMLKQNGQLQLDSTQGWSDSNKAAAEAYLNVLASTYGKFTIKVSDIKWLTSNNTLGLNASIANLKDPWGNSYHLAINATQGDAYAGVIIFYSTGPSGIDKSSQYSSGSVGDNIVDVITPVA